VSTPEDNIKVILADWLDALSRHDLDAIEQRMAPEVFWQGIREDFVCEDRKEAMDMLREQQREEHGVEALELVATEEKVVLGVRSTQLREVGGILGSWHSRSCIDRRPRDLRGTRSVSGAQSTQYSMLCWRTKMRDRA